MYIVFSTAGGVTTKLIRPYLSRRFPKDPPTSPKTPPVTQNSDPPILGPEGGKGGAHDLSVKLALFA